MLLLRNFWDVYKVSRLWMWAVPLCFAAVLAAALDYNGIGNLSWDGIRYLTLAANLETTGRYALEYETLHSKYTPGLPLVAAISSPLFGGVRSAATAWVILSAFCLLALVCFGERSISYRTRLLAAFLLVTHHLFLVHSGMILTEIPFAAASYAFLMLLGQTKRDRTVLLTVTFWAACLFRPEGVLLLIAVLAMPKRQRLNWKTIAYCTSLPGLWWSWVGLNALFIGGESYASELALPSLDLISQQITTISRLGLTLIFLVIIGCAVAPRQSLGYHLYFLASYTALHLTWWFVDVRFYAAVLGSLCIISATALSELARTVCDRVKVPASGIITAGIIVLALFAYCLEQVFLMSAGNRQLYQLDNNEYLALNDPLDALSHHTSWFDSSCSTVLVPEHVVYRYIIGPGAKLVEYRSRLDAKLKLKSTTQPCLVADMIHYGYWNSDPSLRAAEVREAGCRADLPSYQWRPRTGYFLEVFKCG